MTEMPAAISIGDGIIDAVELVPGAVTPVGLVFAYLLVSKFLAVGQAHNLHAGQALAAILAPYLLILVLAAGVSFFGSAYGLDQIPYLDQTLRVLPQLGLLAGIF